MSLEKPTSRSKRPSVEQQEEKAWIGFYRRVGNDIALAMEIRDQLDADAEVKRAHLALYLCCKEALRADKARQERNKRIGQSIRWFCGGLFTQLFVRWPNAWRRGLRQGGDIVAECLPGAANAARLEPGAVKAKELVQQPASGTAQADFQQQRFGVRAAEPAAGSEAEPSAPAPSALKAA